MSIETSNNILYEISSKPIAITKDTSYTISNIIPASSGGAVSAPTDSMANGTTKFSLTNSSINPLDLSKCAIAIDLRTVKTEAPNIIDLAPGDRSLPWNTFGNLFQAIQVRLGSGNNEIFNSSSKGYIYEWTAYMIHKYSFECLNNHPAICTPVSNRFGEEYNNPDIAFPANSAQDTRSRIYYGRFRLICPIQDLLLGCPLFVLRNLRKIDITLTWNNQESLNTFEGSTAAAVEAKLLIQGCQFLANSPVVSAIQHQQAVIEKERMKSDLIAWSLPHFTSYQTQNGDFIISTQQNVEKVVIMQFSKRGAGADATNTSTGQFRLFARNALAAANPNYTQMGDTQDGIESVQLQYGVITYPSTPLLVRQDSVNKCQELYYEYLKAVDTLGAKDSSPLPFSVFSRTMPFVSLKWTSNEAATLDNSGKDMIIKIRTSHNDPATAGIIIFRYVIFALQADGTMTCISN